MEQEGRSASMSNPILQPEWLALTGVLLLPDAVLFIDASLSCWITRHMVTTHA